MTRLDIIIDGISWRMNMGYEIVAVGVSQSEAYQLVKSQYYSIPPNPNQPHIGFIFCIPVFVTNATMYCIGGTEG